MNKLHKIFLALIVFISMIATSQSIQNLDEDYLKSLPDEVRADIESEMEKNLEDDENTFLVRPSSELMKIEMVKDWEDFKRLRLSLELESERYGINLFRSMQSTFMPINEPNFGINYILDYGDFIEINLYGSKEEIYEVEIKRDGTIFIPEVGSVLIAGLDFQEASKKIRNIIKTTFLGIDADINMSKIRDVKILVSGLVEYPGIYTLSGNSNVLQALNIAGGIKENGSLRYIEVKRDGNILKEIDLYDALILGNTSILGQLQSGDSIYIPAAKKLVRAGSGFAIEAMFELKDNETIKDLLNFAGGTAINITEDIFTVVSANKSGTYSIDFDSDEVNKYKLNNLDSLYVPVTELGAVRIAGQINRPGTYTINNGDTLYNIIKKAGGYSENAYVFGSILTSKKAKLLEDEYIKKTYRNIINFIANNPGVLKQNSDIGIILNEIKNFESSGRVVTEFNLNVLEDNPKKSIFLSDGDEIFIPKFDNVVYVYGDINNPSAISYEDFKTPQQYIDSSGGFTRFADRNLIYVVFPNGEASILTSNKFLSALSSNNTDIYPGSLIFVPKQVGKLDGIQLGATLAPIFSSLALSLASLNSIND